MASFDPFEKEFGNRARSLRRTPSNQSWNQLEQRLDRRRRGTRILGIRPWMIAAMFIIVAGITIASNLKQNNNNPLAKRAEFMEELSSPYTPTPGEYQNGAPKEEEVKQDPDFRDVVVADKYRVHG